MVVVTHEIVITDEKKTNKYPKEKHIKMLYFFFNHAM